MKKSFRGIAPLIIIMILIFFAAALLADNGSKKDLSYDELVAVIEADKTENKIDNIELSSDSSSATVRLAGEKEERNVNIPDRRVFMTYVQEALADGADFEIKEASPSIALTLIDYITPIGLVIMLILVWVFMMQTVGGGKGAMSFTKSRAKLFNPEDKNKITFKDVAGLPEEREELQEIVEFLKYPKKFIDMGARIPKGVLLVGQPG
ncbi:MAG: cell division protein FtsH, partial [Clostridia bacterium]|nr:cell division protein FtsH [Clostridia bacterium]